MRTRIGRWASERRPVSIESRARANRSHVVETEPPSNRSRAPAESAFNFADFVITRADGSPLESEPAPSQVHPHGRPARGGGIGLQLRRLRHHAGRRLAPPVRRHVRARRGARGRARGPRRVALAPRGVPARRLRRRLLRRPAPLRLDGGVARGARVRRAHAQGGLRPRLRRRDHRGALHHHGRGLGRADARDGRAVAGRGDLRDGRARRRRGPRGRRGGLGRA